jgi:dihydrofolate reductase
MTTPRIALIVAQAENRVIGSENQMPWHLPEDLKHFKRVTMGKPVIMGRKTFDSIGRPLPGRTNIVITRQGDWQSDGVKLASTLEQALDLAVQAAREKSAAGEPVDEIMVIGGAQIYAQSLERAERIYLTQIHQAFEGDAQFPRLSEGDWCEVASVRSEASEPVCTFVTLDRVTNR